MSVAAFSNHKDFFNKEISIAKEGNLRKAQRVQNLNQIVSLLIVIVAMVK
jgi:hypothetical protein